MYGFGYCSDPKYNPYDLGTIPIGERVKYISDAMNPMKRMPEIKPKDHEMFMLNLMWQTQLTQAMVYIVMLEINKLGSSPVGNLFLAYLFQMPQKLDNKEDLSRAFDMLTNIKIQADQVDIVYAGKILDSELSLRNKNNRADTENRIKGISLPVKSEVKNVIKENENIKEETNSSFWRNIMKDSENE